LRRQREGRHRFYLLNPEPLRAVDSWLSEYRVFWQASLSGLKAFVEAEYAQETGPEVSSPARKLKRSKRNAE
jgi:hypothetical protein